jgi:hypothetical protein
MIPAAPPIIISPSGPNRASKRWPCENNKISETAPSAQSIPIVASEKPSERQ